MIILMVLLPVLWEPVSWMYGLSRRRVVPELAELVTTDAAAVPGDVIATPTMLPLRTEAILLSSSENSPPQPLPPASDTHRGARDDDSVPSSCSRGLGADARSETEIEIIRERRIARFDPDVKDSV